jgi:hypothetical protein
MEIFELSNRRGEIKWEGRPVTSFEAMQRLKQKSSIVNKIGGCDDHKFRFSLVGGDIIELDTSDNKRDLFIVRTISLKASGYHEIEYTKLTSAGLKSDLIKSKQWYSAKINSLKCRNCRKVTISPLGEIHYAND